MAACRRDHEQDIVWFGFLCRQHNCNDSGVCHLRGPLSASAAFVDAPGTLPVILR
jgi:hypothetical protein